MISLFLESHSDTVTVLEDYIATPGTMGYPSDLPIPSSSSIVSYSVEASYPMTVGEYIQEVINYDSASLNYYTDVVVPFVALHNAKNLELLSVLNDRYRDSISSISDRYSNETQEFIDNSNTRTVVIRNLVLGEGVRFSYRSYISDTGTTWYETVSTGYYLRVQTIKYVRTWRSCCMPSEPCSIQE